MIGSTHLHLLILALVFQALLLLPYPGLLPVWGDEQFTLSTIANSAPEILEAVRTDVHPPLYYLLAHYWLQLPLPGMEIERVRLLSIIFALLATVVFERFWLRGVAASVRGWFLALWVLSPFLLLYARMGRSYSLQLLLALLVMHYGLDALRNPEKRRPLLLYVAWSTVLLYTHYLPGIAVPAAVAAVWTWRHRGRMRALAANAGAHFAIAVLYLPWAAALAGAVGTSVASGDYRISGSEVLEHGVRLAYSFVAVNFGESVPAWAMAVAVILSPGILLLLWHGIRTRPEWLPLLPPAASIAYAGAAAAVIFSLTPARMLFLLPFYLLLLVHGRSRLPRIGSAILTGMLILSVAGIASYYRSENFLNKGYVIPFDDIAAAVGKDMRNDDGFLVIDGANTQPTPLVAALPAGTRYVISYDAQSLPEIRKALENPAVGTVWFLRNTNDVSPGGANKLIEREIALSCECSEPEGFVAYGAVDSAAMNLFGWPHRPSHVLELLKCERETPPRGTP